MFGSLFLRECKKLLKSIIYILFIAVALLYYTTQLGGGVSDNIARHNDPSSITEYFINPLVKPLPDQEFYGTRDAEVPEQIIPKTIERLINETYRNSFLTYPFGFPKNITLNKSELEEIKTITEELTGLTLEECKHILYNNLIDQEDYERNVAVFEKAIEGCCDYDTFKAKMLEVEKIVGKGSNYSPDKYKRSGKVNLTYEEALKEYNDFINKDKITGAYAREFCDYMGFVISLYSIFVTVSFLRKDRKSKMSELVYSRKISTPKIIFTRYLACVSMMILPIIVLSLFPSTQLVIYGIQNNISVNPFAYLTHIITWLVPTLMVTTSVGFFFTILTDTHIGIFIQLIWSFVFDMMMSPISSIRGGDYGTQLAVRFNTLGDYQLYKDNVSELVINRVSYTILALVILIITMFIYQQKRRGKINVGAKLQKIFNSHKKTNKAIN